MQRHAQDCNKGRKLNVGMPYVLLVYVWYW